MKHQPELVSEVYHYKHSRKTQAVLDAGQVRRPLAWTCTKRVAGVAIATVVGFRLRIERQIYVVSVMVERNLKVLTRTFETQGHIAKTKFAPMAFNDGNPIRNGRDPPITSK